MSRFAVSVLQWGVMTASKMTASAAPVVVEVRAGANSIIGADAVAKATPDGYTLLYVFTTFVQAPHGTAKMPYDTIKSFAPVSQATINPLWFAVSAEPQAKNVKEYIAEMKASPEKYAYASPGQGSTPHLFGEVLAKRNQLDMLHVPDKGMPPAVLDVVAGTPRAAVDTLSRGINEAIALPEVKNRLAIFGLEPVAAIRDADIVASTAHAQDSKDLPKAEWLKPGAVITSLVGAPPFANLQAR